MSAFQGPLDAITRVRGMRGAMIVSRADGLIIADTLMEGIRGNAVAALAASLSRRLGNATDCAGVGEPTFVHMQATDGALLVMTAGPDVLVVGITEPNVNVGLARLEMLRASEVVR